jgi:pilus assembly protein CpaF
VEIPFHALREQVNSAIDVVVQLSRGRDKARRVVDVAYLSSRRREDFMLNRIVHWDPTHQVGVERGAFLRHPLHPRLAQRLADHGEEIPAGFSVADRRHELDEGGGVAWS